jgi:RNA polymerase sigma-70 factor (ECF subfamily)
MVTVLASPWLASDEDVERPFDAVECALAVRARDGDRRAQRALYERHAPGVRRFVADLLRDRDAASDAFQDTFVRVFQKIGTLEDPSRLVGWVFGIARRVCLEHRRAAFRRSRRTESSERGADVPYQGPSPEAALSFVQSAARLERALDLLGEDRRAVLLLRCDHLLSYDEIATAMGFSVAKVKVEIHRARVALRAALGEEPLS